MNVVGKKLKDNRSIFGKVQYSHFAKLNEKYFGKSLFSKINLVEAYEKQIT